MKGMLRKGLAAVALASALSATGVMAATERVGDFALLDQDGYFHHMSWYDNNRAIVLLTQVNGAPATEQALSSFTALRSQYDGQNFEFFMINPLGQDREAVQRELKSYGTDIPVLVDEVQSISRDLGIKQAGQALVYDPQSFEVVYSGPAGEPLAEAVAAIAEGREIDQPTVAMTEGAPVRYYYRGRTEVSYSEDVAPILAENCARCHRDGGIAPFALDSHSMAQGWAPMIREVLMTKRMPPGQLDPHVGEFENDMVLSEDETQTLLTWIAAGSLRSCDAGSGGPG